MIYPGVAGLKQIQSLASRSHTLFPYQIALTDWAARRKFCILVEKIENIEQHFNHTAWLAVR